MPLLVRVAAFLLYFRKKSYLCTINPKDNKTWAKKRNKYC